MPRTFLTASEGETLDLAHRLGSELKAGAWVLLRGDLGAGKTAFVRGIARARGIDPADVTSPTFVLVQEYRGDVKLLHVDLYRLESRSAIDDLGLDDLATAERTIVAVEWAERLPMPVEGAITVTIEDAGGDARRITIDAPSHPSLITRIGSWVPPS
jgi:tRNA threonylcarbamoyladenosine biosynthesis protein TsaE